jgi:hypothetical protein
VDKALRKPFSVFGNQILDTQGQKPAQKHYDSAVKYHCVEAERIAHEAAQSDRDPLTEKKERLVRT